MYLIVQKKNKGERPNEQKKLTLHIYESSQVCTSIFKWLSAIGAENEGGQNFQGQGDSIKVKGQMNKKT